MQKYIEDSQNPKTTDKTTDEGWKGSKSGRSRSRNFLTSRGGRRLPLSVRRAAERSVGQRGEHGGSERGSICPRDTPPPRRL